jgi:hypothetical protein
MTDFQDKLAERIVAQIKREGFLPAVTAAPGADSLRPEVTKVAADVDKLTGEVDELKQLVKTMTTKLEEHRELMTTKLENQRKLILFGFVLFIGIIAGIQFTLYWMLWMVYMAFDMNGACPAYCSCSDLRTIGEASTNLVNHLNGAAWAVMTNMTRF